MAPTTPVQQKNQQYLPSLHTGSHSLTRHSVSRCCPRCGPPASGNTTMSQHTMPSIHESSKQTHAQRTPNWFFGSTVHGHKLGSDVQKRNWKKSKENLSLPGIDPRADAHPLNQITTEGQLWKVQEWLRRSLAPGHGAVEDNDLESDLNTSKVNYKDSHKQSINSNGAECRRHKILADPFQHPYLVPVKNTDLLPGFMVPLTMDCERLKTSLNPKSHKRREGFTQSLVPQQQLRNKAGPIARPLTPEVSLSDRQKQRLSQDSHGINHQMSSYKALHAQRQRTQDLHSRVKSLLLHE